MPHYRNTDRRKKSLSDWPTVVVTILVCLLCWVTGFYYSLGFPVTNNDVMLPFWDSFTLAIPRSLVYILGLLLGLLIAFIIQRISDIEMFFRERTRLVFLFLFLFLNTNAELLLFSKTTMVLLCLAFMFNELFNAYQWPEATGKIFNVGVLVGVAGLFLPQVLWLLPLIWIGMYQFHALSYRCFLASLTGVLVIFWFVLGWCVWSHDFSMFTSFFSSLMDFELFSAFRSFRYYHASFIVIVILFFTAFFHIKVDAINNRVRVRQMLSFLLNISIWLMVLMCLYRDTDSLVAIFFLPVSVLVAYFVEGMRNRIRFLLYYFVLTVSVFSFISQLWIF